MTKIYRAPNKPKKKQRHKCYVNHSPVNAGIGGIWGPCEKCGRYKVVKRKSIFDKHVWRWKKVSKRKALKTIARYENLHK